MEHWQMMVCPHDTAKNPERWFVFAQYLSQHMDQEMGVADHAVSVRFQQSLDFAEFQTGMAAADLVYANPQHALVLADQHGFLPLARAGNLYDEAVCVTCADCDAALADMHQSSVATVTSMLVTNVALKSLARKDVTPAQLQPAATWMAVVQSIYRGESRFGILYKDFYAGMSPLSRKQIKVLGETEERSVYHCFMLAPRHAARLDAVRATLLSMSESARGGEILAELSMQALLPVEREDLEAIRALRR
ncbi:MAG: PhnD/SsuA/transferrin family substrate-binding protein [Pseudomonadota bacterium]